MADHGHDDGFAHPMPIPTLIAVFVVLTVLTFITVGQASFDLGHYDVAFVMVVATIKASLVMAFFMHLAFDKPFNVILFLGSFVFVGLFVIFTLSDSQMTSKDFIPQPEDPVKVETTSSV